MSAAAPALEIDAVWKALADPTRRAILDTLRGAPQTTSMLAARFPMSRYGVMKHLGRLVDAGLVLVRREGRTRWNHLNPVPIQAIHRRWIRPFEMAPSDVLLRLGAAAESSLPESPMTVPTAPSSTSPQTLDLAWQIAAPPEHVWKTFFDADRWWPEGFFCNAEKATGMRIEERLGGRMVETFGETGGGIVWAEVIGLDPGRQVITAGDLLGIAGGPGRIFCTYGFEAKDGGTEVTLHTEAWGHPSEASAAQMTEGWNLLIGQGLKGAVEGAGS